MVNLKPISLRIIVSRIFNGWISPRSYENLQMDMVLASVFYYAVTHGIWYSINNDNDDEDDDDKKKNQKVW